MLVVVICFKIRIFALRQTSLALCEWRARSLWFALKFVSLRLDKHQAVSCSRWWSVVICFKIRIFALRQTSRGRRGKSPSRLWFALKFVSLRLDKHHYVDDDSDKDVVICFKIRIFALRQTSHQNILYHEVRLWFALKFVSLRLDKHLYPPLLRTGGGCDLL